MVSGGARSRSGPPPDPAALRRDREADWVVLPADGRPGDPPEWPLDGQSPREDELWRVFWARPQAVQWERDRQDFEVALYVRNLAVVESGNAPVNLSTLVRQQGDALGLSIPGLRTNRWRIAPAQAAKSTEGAASIPAPDVPDRPSARSRFRVVRDDVAS